ncbi:putative dimeric dihydrodiol dehydrogenase [Aspergillus nomiae NRRL 13137]|uniref:D-xylose 1-dehydrogenase (NADP(+), D-xylono-1,5-lactone-forming) n=1 Tax=Aspergillus nomiae NRRL (strain ATCC 15546 / NRRL 13137 / CBS 260.88 / M93) TaxID=1509407 RepID=A0A0L1JFB8_ASPN3|nr:putative dimeric dihydrodiol dehydrogenase [Aspergillus nomiae NRRL 13137]KNG90514.1 putative dimeric dihydrodiol dehydrogenase [Aspergillus nomiae NRRL 13137]
MEPKTIRWGILATGGIAETFTKDLLVDPATRNVTSIKHTVVAAASSSGAPRAQAFLTTVCAPPSAKAYGSYEELAADPNVDIIYVATPHSHHYRNVKLCLESGKNVLCEKAFTVNAAQAEELVRIARQKNLFLMEALWTRYFPLSVYVRETITSGRLGTIMRASADNSLDLSPEQNFSPEHRMVSPALAGGALLDMGIYSLTWIFQTLYTTQSPEARLNAPPPRVVSSMQKYGPTGVDETVSMLLTFPRDPELGGDMHGVATTGFRVANDIDGKGSAGPAVRIQGRKGELQVWPPIYRPTRTRLVLADGTVEDKTWPQPGPGKGSNWFNGYSIAGTNPEGEGYGMFWEADEAAMALIEGRKESRYQGLDESVLIMQVMDDARRQNGLLYPQDIEATDEKKQ